MKHYWIINPSVDQFTIIDEFDSYQKAASALDKLNGLESDFGNNRTVADIDQIMIVSEEELISLTSV